MFRPFPQPPRLSGTLRAILSICWLMGAWQASQSQEIPEITTDRPDQTESSSVLFPGFGQIEMGYTHSEVDEDGVDRERDAAPELLLRYGLSERLELRFGLSGHAWEETRYDDGTPTGNVEGWEDSEAGFKYALWAENPSCFIPEAALLAHLSLPSGADRHSTERADPSFRFLFSNTLSEEASLSYNLGAAWETGEDNFGGRDTLSVFQYTVSLGRSLTDRLGMYVELFGDIPMSVDAKPAHSIDGGFTYLLADNFQLDVSTGAGLSEAAEDWFVGAGVSYRFPR